MITANNVFPRGASSVYFENVARSIVTGNRLHSFYPGMLVLKGNCSENMVSSNHFLRDHEPWPPMYAHDNGLDDLYGLMYIEGNDNTITANHISEVIAGKYMKPHDVKPVIIHVVAGKGNYISNNHIVANTEMAETTDSKEGSCFSMQVDALLDVKGLEVLEVINVLVERESAENTVLDSGYDTQVVMDKNMNAFRATPKIDK